MYHTPTTREGRRKPTMQSKPLPSTSPAELERLWKSLTRDSAKKNEGETSESGLKPGDPEFVSSGVVIKRAGENPTREQYRERLAQGMAAFMKRLRDTGSLPPERPRTN